MMPSAVPKKCKTDAEWQALKSYIIRDRQRIKQEQEADAEVQRQKREREQKQKQDVMTLGETKEQIQELQARLSALTEEKHQLFLTLKKVLNEDDNRRRQAFKESSDSLMINISGAFPGASSASYGGLAPQMFLQPLQGRSGATISGPIYKAVPTAGGPLGLPHGAPPHQGTKRPRSPASPPQAAAVAAAAAAAAGYHPYGGYKPAGAAAAAYQPGKADDPHVRRGNEYVRAVLWNKGTAASYGSVYGVPGQAVYSYAAAPAAAYEPVYMPRQIGPAQGDTGVEKVYLRGGAGTGGAGPAPPLPIPVHPSQSAKPGGISAGFPVRGTPPSHQQPAAHGAYLTTRTNGASRLLYGTAPSSGPPNRYQQ